MKKLFFSFLLSLFFSANVFAQSGSIEHSSKEANFRLQTSTPWNQMTIEKKNLDKMPGWIVRFYKDSSTGISAPFALYVVDGRKNNDIKQTSEDFARGHANFILFQMVEAEKLSAVSSELVLKKSEVKTYGDKSFIYLQYENKNITVYKIMTAFNNYTYAINCQIFDPVEEPATQANLELMMKSLSKY